MTTERAREFQLRIAKEALAMMVIYGEGAGMAINREGNGVAHYEETIALIGKAWGLPDETTAENLTLIQRERDALRRAVAGESASHALPEEELPINATGMETLDNIWDLFETAVQLGSREQRITLFHLANELADCQNLLDWIEKTPAERELPEMVIS